MLIVASARSVTHRSPPWLRRRTPAASVQTARPSHVTIVPSPLRFVSSCGRC